MYDWDLRERYDYLMDENAELTQKLVAIREALEPFKDSSVGKMLWELINE